MTNNRIGFERFTAMNDDVSAKAVEAQACGNRLMSAPWRLWEITLCKINNWGHAAFEQGELEMLVCGAIGPAERKVLQRAFSTLVELGRISADSTRLCVVVNDDLWRRGAGKGSWEDACSEPSHRPLRRQVWSARHGWESGRREAPSATLTVPAPATPTGVPVWTTSRPAWTQDQSAWPTAG